MIYITGYVYYVTLFSFNYLDQKQNNGINFNGYANQEIFFSFASLKPMHCYNCIITYDVTHANSHPESINPASGIFTAPENANYFFQFHALVKEHKQAKVQVR